VTISARHQTQMNRGRWTGRDRKWTCIALTFVFCNNWVVHSILEHFNFHTSRSNHVHWCFVWSVWWSYKKTRKDSVSLVSFGTFNQFLLY